MLPEPVAVTIRVAGVLESLGIPYFICGSMASAIYGMLRTTQDSDLIAEMRPEHIEPFALALQADFYVDEESIAGAIARRSCFNLIHRESIFKVDVFIPAMRPFIQDQFARARKQVLALDPQVEAIVATPEDTVLAKLEWFRLGGEVSERQWRDVLGILMVQAGKLDLIYLRRWAKDLQVSDLLERALAEAML